MASGACQQPVITASGCQRLSQPAPASRRRVRADPLDSAQLTVFESDSSTDRHSSLIRLAAATGSGAAEWRAVPRQWRVPRVAPVAGPRARGGQCGATAAGTPGRRAPGTDSECQ